MSILSFFRRPKPEAKTQDRVSFSNDSVTHVRADGIEETIRWDELHEVGILTTDEGPFQEDVFFLLIASDGKSGCVIPQLCDGSQQLVGRLQQLPGFDNEAFIKAMGSACNAKFVCWKRTRAGA